MGLDNREHEPIKTTVSVISGDIAQVASDALITPINPSSGLWYGAIDSVIQKNAGYQFHQQAAEKLPLKHGDTVVAAGKIPHQGKFTNVVFVIDNLEGPLQEVLLKGLIAADKAGYPSVTIPTMRMGVTAGAVEKTPQDVATQMQQAVQRFKAQGPQSLEKITFVVYNNQQTEVLLKEAMGQETNLWHRNGEGFEVGQAVRYGDRVYEILSINGDEAEIHAPETTQRFTAEELKPPFTPQSRAEYYRGTLSKDESSVVFPEKKLRVKLEVLLNGLIAADKAGYPSVTIPTMRMGVTAGAVEKTPQDVATQMQQAVVVYNDQQTTEVLPKKKAMEQETNLWPRDREGFEVGQAVRYGDRVYEILSINGDEAEIHAPETTQRFTAEELKPPFTPQSRAEYYRGTLSKDESSVVFPEKKLRVKLDELSGL